MTSTNVTDYELAEQGARELEADLTRRAARIRDDPDSLLEFLEMEMTEPDHRIVKDVPIRNQLAATYSEAFREGAYGWIDDVLAFRKPWGFDLTKIGTPVLLWHGTEDVFSPPAHTQWLARHIPNARVEIELGAAHFDAVRILPKVLADMKRNSSEGLRVEGPQQRAVSA